MSKDRDERPDEEIEVLDDDLLGEAELDYGVEGDFEDEATTVFDASSSDEDIGEFEEESTTIFDTIGAPASGVVVTAAPQQPAPTPLRVGGASTTSSTPSRPTSPTPAALSRPPTPSSAEMPTQVRAGAVQVAAPRRVTDSTSQQTVVTSAPRAAPLGPRPSNRAQSNAPLIALSLILLAALGALLFLLLRAPSQVPQTSTVAVFSSPSDAAILVNGEPYHQRTPATLTDLVPGEAVTLELQRDGYQSVSELITPGESLITREFELLPVPGSVVVRTFPDGAMVAIDGAERGPAPVTIADLDRGSAYLLTATLEGHEVASRELAWASDSRSELAVLLTLTPTTVEREGSGAQGDAVPNQAIEQALIDAASVTAEAPASDTPREPQRSAAETPASSSEARPEPRRERTRSTSAATEQQAPAPVERRAPATTERQAPAPEERQEPSRAEASTPPTERPSQRPSERPSERAADLAPQGEGSLSVQALPYGQVYVNGRMVAAETPLINHTLEAGVYTVKVYHVPLRQWSEDRTVRIETDERRTLTFRAE